ncbi:SUMO-activating enzyme subunit 2-B [Cloeon dipterum]|uniref:SUMO-activating enzyme subunit 2-B n=1 Tax=Cloeon dipterum TaxID=197152 RepID=UPI00321F6BEA
MSDNSKLNCAVGVDLRKLIDESKVLVVGAGGIGCELLKNLVLAGFNKIDLIDLDTIDVSNLNRQFLFQRCHVGKSKALSAKESALRFNPRATINAHHDSITESRYGVNYFKEFNLVLNALDNRAARSHVNRMCLAAGIPLVESGTAGYNGQVEVIMKGKTECYECQPKQATKTFPGCTIRNTPSEPIHCIVWAKHLFNQFFGVEDPDEDVSPDTADPEAVGDAGSTALDAASQENGNIERVSTRQWAKTNSYNAEKLFQKLFKDDIQYLLSMSKLWEKRKAPVPLNWGELPNEVAGSSKEDSSRTLKDQIVWSIAQCGQVFEESVQALRKRVETTQEDLVWDKDDEECLNFVVACANIRSHIFGISCHSKFDIKAMAGNIIPAIATTNAVIAGMIVLRAFQVLQQQFDKCKTVYLQSTVNPRGLNIVPEADLIPPNKSCYVCSEKPQVHLYINTETSKICNLEEILKTSLHMVAPDVMHESNVVISSEEGELDNGQMTLKEVGIVDGALLKCDDYLQNYELSLIIYHWEPKKDEPAFKIVANPDELKPKEEDEKDGVKESDDEGIVEVEVDQQEVAKETPPRKRKLSDVAGESSKKLRCSEPQDDIIVL